MALRTHCKLASPGDCVFCSAWGLRPAPSVLWLFWATLPPNDRARQTAHWFVRRAPATLRDHRVAENRAWSNAARAYSASPFPAPKNVSALRAKRVHTRLRPPNEATNRCPSDHVPWPRTILKRAAIFQGIIARARRFFRAALD